MQVINLISWRLIPVSLLFIFNMNVFSCEKLSYYNELSKYVANYPDVQKSYLDLQRTRETLARNLSFNYFQQESSKAFSQDHLTYEYQTASVVEVRKFHHLIDCHFQRSL